MVVPLVVHLEGEPLLRLDVFRMMATGHPEHVAGQLVAELYSRAPRAGVTSRLWGRVSVTRPQLHRDGPAPGTDKGRYVREDPRNTDYRPKLDSCVTVLASSRVSTCSNNSTARSKSVR